jgi:serine protease Do
MRFDKAEIEAKPGQKIRFVFNNYDDMQHNFVLGKPKSADKIGEAAGKLGISVEPVPADVAERMKLAGRGVRVSDVAEDGPARDKLAAGSDIVLEVLYPTPRRAVKTVNDLQGLLSGLKDGDYVSLLVRNMDPRVGERVVNIRVGG